MKILELFGGIGACSKALERIGIDYEIADYVEIDKYAVKSFNAIHDTHFESQDIREWDKNIDVDLIMHGSPCQDFSVAGKGKGGDEGSGTRSSLMYETIRIVNKLKPKYVIWENVKNLLSKKHKHNFDKYVITMNSLGYNSYYQVLNAKDYGIPQNRERVFTISIRQDIDTGYTFPEKQELKLKLKDMLENNVDEKYYLTDKQIERIQTTSYISGGWNARIQTGVSGTLCARDYKDPKCIIADYRYDEGLRVRKELICPTITRKVGSSSPSEQPLWIKNNTKKGYLEAREGDGIYTNTSNKRGTVQKEMIPALTSFQDKGVVVNINNKRVKQTIENNIDKLQENSFIDSYNKQVNNTGISGTITTRVNDSNCTHIINNLRIRKLTPKECWRLMGFDDSDFEKAEKVNSNSQLYKQAGNSIVVNVLERILENLLIKKQTEFIGQTSLFERRI